MGDPNIFYPLLHFISKLYGMQKSKKKPKQIRMTLDKPQQYKAYTVGHFEKSDEEETVMTFCKSEN
jgi:hypothetical protein